MGLVRFIELLSVHVDGLATHVDCFDRQTEHAFYEWDVTVRRRLDSDDVHPALRAIRQIWPDSRGIVRRKNQFVEKEVIADENCRLQGFSADLGCLRHVVRKYENENNGKEEAFDPFSECALTPRSGVEDCQIIETDIGPLKNRQLIEEHVRNL